MTEPSALDRAMAMVTDLRARCPWDRVQTRDTLRPYLVEEAHELDQALSSGDPATVDSGTARRSGISEGPGQSSLCWPNPLAAP